MEKLTILLPIYNGIEYIDEAINSIKQQSFTDWKLLIGVNGHQLNSDVFKKCDQYKSEKIEVFDFDFKGKPKTLNTLLKTVKSDAIALIDADDTWEPLKLETQYKYLEFFDVIGTFARYFGEKSGCPNIPFGHIHRRAFFEMNPIINSSALLKTKHARWDETLNMLEDYDLWLRLCSEKKSFLNIPNILTNHRIHKESFFNTKSENDQNFYINQLRQKWNI